MVPGVRKLCALLIVHMCSVQISLMLSVNRAFENRQQCVFVQSRLAPRYFLSPCVIRHSPQVVHSAHSELVLMFSVRTGVRDGRIPKSSRLG